MDKTNVFSMYYVRKHKCYYHKNIIKKDTWFGAEIKHIRSPEKINKNNDCSWYSNQSLERGYD